ncbi:MAG: glycosyltransferase [Bacillaceae bacterium]|nr:glycosyltransferase [Bacillaceae bacterium]
MPKRIAFVRTRYLPPSETFIYEELKNIKHYKPIVYTRKRMNLSRFPYKKIKTLPKHPRSMARKFKRNNIKLIHARFGTAGVKCVKVKRFYRVPLLTSFHGFDLPVKKNKRKSYLRQLPRLFRKGDRFTVPCHFMKNQMKKLGCPSHKIEVLYSGIDLNRFPYEEREPRTENVRIVGVGRLHKKKGFKYLIKAFKKVLDVHPTAELVIIGKGDERKNLKQKIKQYNLGDHVKLKGEKKHHEITKELKRADIFCLPSITTSDGNHEGIPNAIKEAMATGLPVVSTWHGGIPELVTDEVDGYLVREKDVDGLADRLITLIENPELRLEMGVNGRYKVVEQFNSARQVKQLESIYKKLIRKGGRKK